MEPLVSPEQWEGYKQLMRQAHDTFNKKIILWVTSVSVMDPWGEEHADNPIVQVPLEVLILYNYARAWPLTRLTVTGAIDIQSCQILINKRYLAENGWLNAAGRFIYNQAGDTFILDGLVYSAQGDTDVAQAYDEDMFFSIILQRTETKT